MILNCDSLWLLHGSPLHVMVETLCFLQPFSQHGCGVVHIVICCCPGTQAQTTYDDIKMKKRLLQCHCNPESCTFFVAWANMKEVVKWNSDMRSCFQISLITVWCYNRHSVSQSFLAASLTAILEHRQSLKSNMRDRHCSEVLQYADRYTKH